MRTAPGARSWRACQRRLPPWSFYSLDSWTRSACSTRPESRWRRRRVTKSSGRERLLSGAHFQTTDGLSWAEVHRNFRSMLIPRMTRGRHEMLRGKLSTTTNLRGRPHILADDKSKLPASTYGARTRWSSRKTASPSAMDKPLARSPLRRERRASYVPQDAEFATNAGRRDYERQ
jgi:hypothetical protein